MTGRWGTTSLGLVSLLVGLLAQSGCPRTRQVPTEGCEHDMHCKGERVCVEARCVPPPPVDAGVPAVDAASATAEGAPPFAMFGGNGRHTGALAGPAPTKQPTEVWRVSLGGPIAGSPIVGPDGTVYVTSHDGHLYAIDANGKQRWKFATADRVWSTPAVAEDGTVYIGSDDDNLYAVAAATGKLRWKLRLGRCEPTIGFGPEGARCDVDGGPTIGADGTIYVGGDGIHAVWPDGRLRWKLATGEHVSTAPAIDDDGIVYAGSQDDSIYAINPDGTKRWELRTRGDVESSPAVGADGTVYAGSDDDLIYAITAGGELRWKVATRGDVRASPAIGSDGTVYVGSYDNNLYAIEPNGAVRWRFAAADKIHGAAGIATNGVIVVGAQDGHLYAIDPSGVMLWYLTLDGDVDPTPALSGDGTLYVVSDDHTVRAFR